MLFLKLFKRKKLLISLFIGLGVFICLQFIRPEIKYIPVAEEISVPAEVKNILTQSCFDCHSNKTKLKWFDKIVPAYWLVANHVEQGRKALNFSDWNSFSNKKKKGTLYTAINFAMLNAMPPKEYVLLHPEAKLSSTDIKILKKYARDMTPVKPSNSSHFKAAKNEYDNWIKPKLKKISPQVPPAPNGIEYIKGYENWTVISTTDRFDNGTMRVIYANDIAVKAIKNEHINPWPKGSIFAKVLWKELIDSSGVVKTGEFIHAEFMIKNAEKYASTYGWGWARWVGDDLKPHGETALFAAKCMRCHKPMKKNDYVFTMPLQLNLKKQ